MSEKTTRRNEGGHARAAALSPEERSAIAKKAAAERWHPTMPNEDYSGTIKVADREIPCAVLSNGMRVLSMRGVNTAFTGSGGGGATEIGAQKLPRFLSLKSLKPFISEDLMARLISPVEYKPKHGGRTAYGYEASLLVRICGALLDAKAAGALKNADTAKVAEILVRGFAEVGINALIDEATGYQEVRPKEALQAILDAYLRKELAAWAKRFPDEFYEQIFRLKNWQWKGRRTNPPQVVATYTKDIVYMRLAENILQELEAKNPADAKGRRKSAHHQWLSDDVGHLALAQHLHAVIGLMRVSTSWEQFKQMLDVAFPKRGETLSMALLIEAPVTSRPN